AIVNDDAQLVNGECMFNSSCSMKNLSCRYLSHLTEHTRQIHYANLSAAQDAVKQGHVWGVLFFNENYSDSLVARLALADAADEETVRLSDVQVWLDMSNQHIGLTLNRDILYAYRDFAQARDNLRLLRQVLERQNEAVHEFPAYYLKFRGETLK
ncbi:hypothetical protein evm_015421, partial [Chilo suppressalis]